MKQHTIRITVEVKYVEGWDLDSAQDHAAGLAESVATAATMSRRVDIATWSTGPVQN